MPIAVLLIEETLRNYPVDGLELTLNYVPYYFHPAEIGEVLLGSRPGRSPGPQGDGEVTVYRSLGVIGQDIAAARAVLARARELGVGVEVPWS